ncbi:dolichyl-phosphate-mannose-protein mannosyltransferase PMT6 Ecym_7372 [Eremothecium cymbalariae DBVPG|uniref:Dolichyl-phosphate-mannose--protein mannosyltransferase n=1 Tax=Eremothecium cymbalariae (strain CBS 270.75 / DBVPG 7215 / KCTC 17166 / NRRL Y-17582) TaxID=931890 RepID=G8JWI3_ERECY|nr:hypothetical protein Ecym_7372 [Eremothecium cymbalariae DBVPG\
MVINDSDSDSDKMGSLFKDSGIWRCKDGDVASSWVVAVVFLLFVVGSSLRFSGIDGKRSVIWDETHFCKFGSYYLKHEFYHDVHPPLGKMLIGLSEWLAGFQNSEGFADFSFNAGAEYGKDVNLVMMRGFHSVVSGLCIPLVFLSGCALNFSTETALLVTVMVALDHSYIVLSKFVLLDSMLLFFTATTFYCLLRVHSLRDGKSAGIGGVRRLGWLLLCGVSIGCVCSVKWVGVFVTVLVGIYTLVDLLSLGHVSRKRRLLHWLIRGLTLIVVPLSMYALFFKIHFALLYKSGTGDSIEHSIFQANLEGSSVGNSPRDILYESSSVTIRSYSLVSHLLRSQLNTYPKDSSHHVVTGSGFSDGDNVWVFQSTPDKDNYDNAAGVDMDNDDDNGPHGERNTGRIRHGSIVRLLHNNTKSHLHSRNFPSHVSDGNYEVSTYGDESTIHGNDNWVVEIVRVLDAANSTEKGDPVARAAPALHPVSTCFRLRNEQLGCYLATTGLIYPSWGFNQAEIVCKYSWVTRDKSTWWNVEDHWNENLAVDHNYTMPKSEFWLDVTVTNFAMLSLNNGLLPDPDRYDPVTSKAWTWPLLRSSIQLSNGGSSGRNYLLLGSPFNTWLSSASLLVFVLICFSYLIKWKRQLVTLSEPQFWDSVIRALLPFLGWLFHYLPFVMMDRVTYTHHYVPALYFAILTFGFSIDYLLAFLSHRTKCAMYALLFAGAIYNYIFFEPFAQGFTGESNSYKHLKWLSSWDIM